MQNIICLLVLFNKHMVCLLDALKIQKSASIRWKNEIHFVIPVNICSSVKQIELWTWNHKKVSKLCANKWKNPIFFVEVCGKFRFKTTTYFQNIIYFLVCWILILFLPQFSPSSFKEIRILVCAGTIIKILEIQFCSKIFQSFCL